MYILVALVVIAAIVVMMYNGLVKARQIKEEAWSGIDVQLKRRADLIPNLVETVKGYAAHEKSTLDAVISARAKATRWWSCAIGRKAYLPVMWKAARPPKAC